MALNDQHWVEYLRGMCPGPTVHRPTITFWRLRRDHELQEGLIVRRGEIGATQAGGIKPPMKNPSPEELREFFDAREGITYPGTIIEVELQWEGKLDKKINGFFPGHCVVHTKTVETKERKLNKKGETMMSLGGTLTFLGAEGLHFDLPEDAYGETVTHIFTRANLILLRNGLLGQYLSQDITKRALA